MLRELIQVRVFGTQRWSIENLEQNGRHTYIHITYFRSCVVMFTFSLFVFFTPCLFEFIFKYKIGVYRLCELYSGPTGHRVSAKTTENAQPRIGYCAYYAYTSLTSYNSIM